jgi:hypothetical protein
VRCARVHAHSYFYRALQPYVHYIPFWRTSPHDILDAVAWAEQHPVETRLIARRARGFVQRHLSRTARLCYWRMLLQQYSALLRFSPSLSDWPIAIALEDDPLMNVASRSLNGKISSLA